MPAPVHRQHNMAAEDRRVVEQLVIAALQEGGIDREHRRRPPLARPDAKVTAVLFRDPDIKKAVGEARGEILRQVRSSSPP